ncbi:hypothetical protein LRS10_13575 [Phenylobacterium sp. J426]|uniref:hypothetical protein n=1 Tax=Phenylobacterium sp. J426 TaxID=2898439 RepID=UPI002151EB16|nr:hypothetical protein [Phenylobacterium sp. J426]MCR5875123.1 hypothetical protein [Phenylobacterium sp. J426]
MSLRRPKNPGSRRHVERTPAQETAWRIFRLRALWHQACLLTRVRADAVRALIDDEIVACGGEAECFRRAKREADHLAEIDEKELPF